MAFSAKLKSLLKEWDGLKQQMAPLKKQLSPLEEKERAIRKQIIEQFQDKVEGSKNNIELANGYKLKLTYKVNYALDDTVLKSLGQELAEKKIPVEMLVNYTPQLNKSVYKSLSAEQKELFDAAVVRTEGSHTLEIVEPKQ